MRTRRRRADRRRCGWWGPCSRDLSVHVRAATATARRPLRPPPTVVDLNAAGITRECIREAVGYAAEGQQGWVAKQAELVRASMAVLRALSTAIACGLLRFDGVASNHFL